MIVLLPWRRRFAFKVYERGDCWEWRGRITPQGYGVFVLDGLHVPAHRVAYEMAKGPVPSGLDIDHLCRHRWCVRPSHLEAVTRKANILRGVGATARQARKTHCNHGHEFTPENTYHWKTSRICRACRSETSKRRHHAA